MNEKELWDKALIEIELNTSKPNFNTWFKDTFIHKIEEGLISVGVPNAFVREWLSNKYHSFILKTLRELFPEARSVEYVVNKNNPNKKGAPKEIILTSVRDSLPLDDHYVNKENNLNPRYMFDTFVVGPFNELAHAAAQAVVERPGIVYNPLFVYGNTGHGKTHLIQAVGNQVAKNENKKVFYVTSEKFATDYINSVHSGKVNNFKEKYRKYDVLIMDDIQFFAGKEKSQEELFHLFNHLYDNNKQIIFSSDKHPNYINNLEDRLKSRFGAGMIVDIPTPDLESRMAILRKKLDQNNISLNEEVLNYLAVNITGNIRELEGVLNTINCQVELKQKDLTLNEVKYLVKDTSQRPKTKTPQEVVKIVSDYYSISEETIYEKTRRKEVIKPRQIIMYLLRKDFNISYPSIGQKMGGRDHTTVIHSCEKIENAVGKDDVLAQEIHQIRSMLV
ncbi:MAG: chromosomal replication initiator protein DnaA [Candidatus Pacebacteria bacterium]|nr:chromosomal replication initiator protein DnaA [Candidatus Paceibacterota bacterium]